MSALLLKEDSEILGKVLRVGLTGGPGDLGTPRGPTDPFVELAELTTELEGEGGPADLAER